MDGKKTTRKRRGDGKPTIRNVAIQAGVSPITVSRALRDPDRVSPELRERVDLAVKELNYVPNLSARTLASHHTDVVGVLVPSLASTIFSDVLKGISDGIASTRLQIQVATNNYSNVEEYTILSSLLRQKPAGIIVSGTQQSPQVREMIQSSGVPVVQIMELATDPIDMMVGFSHHQAGLKMTEHLIEMGYKRIGFVGGGRFNNRALSRLEGFTEALRKANMFDANLILIEDKAVDAVMGRQAFRALHTRSPDVDAVFCNNDQLALGALFEAASLGLDVPEQIGIAGFNDSPVLAACNPSLSTVLTRRYEVGRAAIELLSRRLEGDDDHTRVIDVGFEIIKRDSTARKGSS